MVVRRALAALLCVLTMMASSGTAPAAAVTYPSQVLNLTNWKLTLPIDGADDGATADEVTQPQLATYEHPDWFHVAASDPSWVYFRANVEGATNSGAEPGTSGPYPRSELREMDGSIPAAWDPVAAGQQHVITITEKITAQPLAKPDVVAGQIHDGINDVLQIRLEGRSLFASLDNGRVKVELNPDYSLGTPFSLRIVVSSGLINVTYNNVAKVTGFRPINAAPSWFFKAGVYTQSNTAHDEAGQYGEVAISSLTIEHGPVPPPPTTPPTPPPPTPVYCAGQIATQVGSGNGEVIYGTAGTDVIAAGGGNDIVYGLGGDDVICGGSGDDTVKAGAGTDQLYGEDGADKLAGGVGTRDLCNGGPARDRAKGCEVRRSI